MVLGFIPYSHVSVVFVVLFLAGTVCQLSDFWYILMDTLIANQCLNKISLCGSGTSEIERE